MWYCIRWSFKPAIILLLAINSGLASFSQSVKEPEFNYRQVFGNRYDAALDFLKIESWIKDSILSYGLDPDFAIAVIFPELIRFSAIQDRIEVTSLKVLYVQFGEEYADFSVGPFQMKPSFAESIEADAVSMLTYNELKSIGLFFPTGQSETDHRNSRVNRLDNLHWQVKYLAVFMKIMDNRHLSVPDDTEKLKLYATAYNCGYWKGLKLISSEMNKKRFHTDLFNPEIKYNYADISLDYYLNYTGK